MPRWSSYTELKEYFSNPFNVVQCSWASLTAHPHGDKFLLSYYGKLIGELEEGNILTLRCENKDRVWTSDSNRYSMILPDGWEVRRRKNDGFRTAANVVRVYNSVYNLPLVDGLRFNLDTKEVLNPEIAQDFFKRLDRKKAAAIRKQYKPMFDFLYMLIKVDGFIVNQSNVGYMSNTDRFNQLCKILEQEPSSEAATKALWLCNNSHAKLELWLDKCLTHLYERDGAYRWIPASQLNHWKGKK